ncbi:MULTISPECIES: IclR family transcriptional regulator [unclassified Streptomyces]|uniref:IclR family transcriptional regulator n=1 Tax=unclassified Streptomyces TaxID=2593676 RepID=UPI0022B6850D|nr:MULTISPECIES: IclR family transcriptional regulator C-terminal domain-containing protein [unclassified Streptomyces]MCZ7414450.1 helix-turn-helix domain-containing protein [Streptomyces sp. WMMC897]MCZ7431406.1 helix-turn-helix domain-containing protein [Streptomyces sp. WMMC1477]
MMPKPVPAASYRAVQRALRLLEAVSRNGDGIAERALARQAAMPPAELARMLAMLRTEGYVERLPDGGYVTGEALRRLGSSGDHQGVLREQLHTKLSELRDDIGAAVYISRYEDGEVRITQFSAGANTPPVAEWVDFKAAAHASAVGKALLTQLDHDGRRDHLSRHKTIRLTSRTTTNERALLSELDSRPPTVPVLDLQEYAIGTVCAAVPLTAGASVGCLALSLPIRQAHRLRSAARRLNEQAAPVLLSLCI